MLQSHREPQSKMSEWGACLDEASRYLDFRSAVKQRHSDEASSTKDVWIGGNIDEFELKGVSGAIEGEV